MSDKPASRPPESALFTDLYELKMLQAYHRERMEGIAVFDLYVRKLPPERNFLLAAGIDDALRYLEELHFEDAELAYLKSLGYFTPEFLDGLSGYRFGGSVWAVPEGTPVFADEPILEVVAPIAEAQLVETYLLNQISFQTLIASKGVRSVLAAQGKPVIDFGARRAQGTDAALKGARALHIAGFHSTSNMLAGQRYGLPVTGTQAHSYIEAHDGEAGAFREFAALYPETTLLVDTYDTEAGVRRVVALAQQLGADFRVRSIRLDSGDLGALAHRAREILDAAGLAQVGIIASGGLDEYAIAALVSAGAPIDAYAVGTSVITSADAPKLDTAYKLVEYAGRGRMKLSTHKATLPGRKQVFRRFDGDMANGDLIALRDEPANGEPLLREMMRDGHRLTAASPSLAESRVHAARQLARLPPGLLSLAPADTTTYPVRVSDALRAEQVRVGTGLGKPAPKARECPEDSTDSRL